MRRLITLAATASSAAAGLLPAPVALASHETRNMDLQRSGVDLWIFWAVIALTIFALVAFAAAILWWERRDRVTADQDAA